MSDGITIYMQIHKMNNFEVIKIRKNMETNNCFSKDQRYNNILEYWKNRLPFNNEDDIPDIPIVLPSDYNEIIIPNIIRCGGIPKDKLVEGKEYIGNCRNSNKAIWTGKCFTYTRYKFGSSYEDNVNHFEDDDGYDVFVPIKLKECYEK